MVWQTSWLIFWQEVQISRVMFASLLVSEGEMEVFRMEVTIPGRNRAVFLLTYEELLQRRLGRYEHVTSVRPMQLVSRLSVGVTIVEHSRISYLEVLPLRNGKTTSSNGNGKADGNQLYPIWFLSVYLDVLSLVWFQIFDNIATFSLKNCKIYCTGSTFISSTFACFKRVKAY